MNQDGRSSSLTAPNGPAQQDVLRAALANGGLTPADLSGLQMHGTGTALGDPIEVGAALQAYYAADTAGSKLAASSSHTSSSAGASSSHALYLLAAKATVGHAEPAAGLTGLIYAAQQAAAAAALPIQHLRRLNPYVVSAIDSAWPAGGAAGGSLVMSRTAMPLQSLAGAEQQGLLALGVSAFAFQGSNAHAIVTSKTFSAGALMSSRRASGSAHRGGWGSAGALSWSTARVWVHPEPCTLLTSVVKAAPERGVMYELQLSVSHLAHTWDHIVAGSALVPGVLFMEMAACAVQQSLAGATSTGSLLAALSSVSIPAALVLPEHQQAVVLRCLVQQHLVQVASSTQLAGRPQHNIHLQAQPTTVHANSTHSTSSSGSAHPDSASQRWLVSLFASLPSLTQAQAPADAAAATATVAAFGVAAASGCGDPAQLDALLQLAAVQRGSVRPDLAHTLQVPAAAELYVSAAAAAAGNSRSSSTSTSGSGSLLAWATIRPGLTASGMVADLELAAAEEGSQHVCSIAGLQAKKATAAALVRQSAAATTAPANATADSDADVSFVHCDCCPLVLTASETPVQHQHAPTTPHLVYASTPHCTPRNGLLEEHD
jgi:hypothetical protein